MKTRYKIIILTLFLSTFLFATEPTDESRPLLMTHFMPWNQAPPVTSFWGWHWTMNHFNPENFNENGQREIASHYYPLTGPYDSMEPDIMEYQVLLMKLSGIDGIIVDWYGTGELWDYPAINERTNAMFEVIERAELKFSICYEDQTLRNLIDQTIIFDDEKYEQGQQDIKYVEDTWFSREAYLKIDDRPVLLNFGPQFFKQSSEWETIFSVLESQPLFFTEDNRVAPAAVGAFSWPPMWKSRNGVLTQAALQEYLNQFSSKSAAWEYRISSAFPGFHDIYKEAGVGDGYGFLDANNGTTFELTLDQALTDNPNIIQLVTWDDYGEGTMIEPTEETGYRYLEMVQALRASIDSTFSVQPGHLRLPLQVYNLRQAEPNNVELNTTLDRIFELFIDMKLDSAEALLETITQVEQTNKTQPLDFSLQQNYPNPFNARTTIRYSLAKPAEVQLRVFNSAGQLVAELDQGEKAAGTHAVVWDAEDVASGVYIYRLQAGRDFKVEKCLLVK